MYRDHQIAASDAAWEILKRQGVVGIFGLPRTGKTRAAIRTASLAGDRVKRVLVLTKKNAIPGWHKELAQVKPDAEYVVTNYEQVTKVQGKFDLAIIDESHNLGTRGRPSQRVKDIRKACFELPLITLSGTPTIETPLGIYHQWCVSKYSPFKSFKNFYGFFRRWGIPNPIWIKGRTVEQYKVAKDELMDEIEKYVVRITQEEAGIEHLAQDRVHLVHLDGSTQQMIAEIMSTGNSGEYFFDSDIGIRTAVHQIESGGLLYEDELLELPNTEVVDFLLEKFGDSEDVAFFTHFRSTRKKLSRYFQKALLLSSMAHAEGVDMSHMRHVVIVNTGYSGAKFTQLRERVVNMTRTTEALVHHIVTDGGISQEVYQMVKDKKDFNLEAFRRVREGG